MADLADVEIDSSCMSHYDIKEGDFVRYLYFDNYNTIAPCEEAVAEGVAVTGGVVGARIVVRRLDTDYARARLTLWQSFADAKDAKTAIDALVESLWTSIQKPLKKKEGSK